ncbi:MAG: hypothetical protein CSA54_03135 [Gammaproteobacteria bacterium]|nr:MAG: hypothetical protein CSA54_03135 [Gammaproteobacteria bacterium]
MRDLLTEKATGLAPTRITGKLPLGLGDRQHAVTQLKERLIETGDLGYFARLDWHFDAELEEALQRFQTRSGLEDTGILDDRTLAELNLPIEEEIERIALSLERWRWMPRKLGKRHIIVNIPNYKVEMYDGHQLILDMVAVVGAARYPTPNFSRDMSYIEFNPTWTVPSRIVNEELVPRERRRPGYLASRNFAFFRHTGKGLREVPASSVPRSAFRQTPFPYVLRQRSGAGNALGRMKFMMPNPHAIYLHDTQAKELFEHHDRAYSHGCIRLGDPEYFARLLMRLDGRSESEIEQALAERETHRVRLRSRIPTHLIYMTTWVDAYGAIQHRRDVYQHDANLVAALKRANTLLNVMNTLDVATVEIKDRNLNALLASR